MSIAPHPESAATAPTPTPESRCKLALSLLQHRPYDERLVELIAAVMRGVTLGELVDLEVVTDR